MAVVNLEKRIASLMSENRLLLQELEYAYERLKKLSMEKLENEPGDISYKKIKYLMQQNDIMREQLEILKHKNKAVETHEELTAHSAMAENEECSAEHTGTQKPVNSVAMENSADFHILAADAYAKDGMQALETLLDELGIHAATRAEVYANIAKTMKQEDAGKAAALYLRAWRNDGAPLRLKDLAIAYWNNGEMIKAGACARLLPHDMKLTENERLIIDIMEKALDA